MFSLKELKKMSNEDERGTQGGV
uniref:Uncharacterized protein n=1 Tax=Arundo donax TaxID=35708 RepID=A0A0A9BI32_ARUDO